MHTHFTCIFSYMCVHIHIYVYVYYNIFLLIARRNCIPNFLWPLQVSTSTTKNSDILAIPQTRAVVFIESNIDSQWAEFQLSFIVNGQ